MVRKKYWTKKKFNKLLVVSQQKEQKNKTFKQQIKLKNKIVNYQLKNGNKRTCEKNFIQTLKFFQKVSFKDYKSVIQLAIINKTPIFMLKEIKKRRKETLIPFLAKEKFRIAHAIKNILKETSKKKYTKKNYENLTKEILLNADKKNETLMQQKLETQEQVLKQRKQLSRFRWF
jgi:ribosomal protein S7